MIVGQLADRTGRTLSVMPTWRCSAACGNCGTMSNPKVKTYLDVAHVLSAIDQAAEAGYSTVVFTGGEATLAWETLVAGIEHATRLGLPSRLVTNAHWAVTPARAEQRVQALRTAGLTEINFSTGDQHARFVPVARVIAAADAALGSGLRVAIMVETTKERAITRETIETDPAYIALAERHGPVMINESPWMPLSASVRGDYEADQLVNARTLPAHGGCDSVLSTTTVQADGTIAACCGIGMRLIPELQIGDIRSTPLVEADRRAGDDFLKRWIRVEGPERILAWAAVKDPAIEWEDMYAHRCQACLRLYQDPRVRQVIRDHHAEKIADVLYAEWLLLDSNAAKPGANAVEV
jgi:hypothetical protein